MAVVAATQPYAFVKIHIIGFQKMIIYYMVVWEVKKSILNFFAGNE